FALFFFNSTSAIATYRICKVYDAIDDPSDIPDDNIDHSRSLRFIISRDFNGNADSRCEFPDDWGLLHNVDVDSFDAGLYFHTREWTLMNPEDPTDCHPQGLREQRPYANLIRLVQPIAFHNEDLTLVVGNWPAHGEQCNYGLVTIDAQHNLFSENGGCPFTCERGSETVTLRNMNLLTKSCSKAQLFNPAANSPTRCLREGENVTVENIPPSCNIDVCYRDADRDGFGNSDENLSVSPVQPDEGACHCPRGYVRNDDDCNDFNHSMRPGAVGFRDRDGDHLGDPNETIPTCIYVENDPERRMVGNDWDCDDSDPEQWMDEITHFRGTPQERTVTVPEIPCDGRDNNCNGVIDESPWCRRDGTPPPNDPDEDNVPEEIDTCPEIANADNADRDRDGVGDACDNCPRVPNANQTNRDHDDLGDACDFDNDNDGFCSNTFSDAECPDNLRTGDCNDADPNRNPGAADVCGDNRDLDCNGSDGPANGAPCGGGPPTPVDIANALGEDKDDDGFCSLGAQRCNEAGKEPRDCDDENATIKPGANDRCGDGIDQDCSGTDQPCHGSELTDDDEDGFCEAEPGVETCSDGKEPGDCNDDAIDQNPNAPEICNNRFDDNCNGVIDESICIDLEDTPPPPPPEPKNKGDGGGGGCSLQSDLTHNIHVSMWFNILTGFAATLVFLQKTRGQKTK
ncbi:MAG TPA: hypothetical protein DDW49_06475, partial [Deltaproteobacteria bacterium]|nr:hypothetical protein [Deltaproteobacteria bacterium]